MNLIGQHLQSSTSFLKRRWAFRCGFYAPKKRRQLNHHYIAQCVTPLANKIQLFLPVLHISRCMMIPGDCLLSLGDRAAPPATMVGPPRRENVHAITRAPHPAFGLVSSTGQLLLLIYLKTRGCSATVVRLRHELLPPVL